MFDPVLNLTPSVYEAIIAAFVILGLLQSVALRRKWYQVAELKKVVAKLAVAGTAGIMKAIMGGVAEIAKLERRVQLATARADAMQERAETAERELMEAAADHDDEVADRRGTAIDPSTLFFGDSHFADFESRGFPGSRGFPTTNPAPNDANDLRSLFALLDGKGRNGAALDDLIFGDRHPNVRVVNGGDFVHDTGNRGVTLGHIESLLRGDASGIEKALGAKCVGVEVIGPNGKPLVGAEKDDVLREFFGADFGRTPGFTAARPSFDPLEIDPAAFGTRVHENIERHLAAARDFGPDSGQEGRKASLSPDESCSTQEPRSYPASSPRAG